jgi:hypothetical protein
MGGRVPNELSLRLGQLLIETVDLESLEVVAVVGQRGKFRDRVWVRSASFTLVDECALGLRHGLGVEAGSPSRDLQTRRTFKLDGVCEPVDAPLAKEISKAVGAKNRV